jgi:hypothetical protein
VSIPLDRLFDDFARSSTLCAGAGGETGETLNPVGDIEELSKIVWISAPQIPDVLGRLKPVVGYGIEAYS